MLLLALGLAGHWGLGQYRLSKHYRAEIMAFLAEEIERFENIPLLTARENRLLRRSLNAVHLREGRRLGITPVAERDSLMLKARRCRLQDLSAREEALTSPPYVLRRGAHSIHHVTADAAAALDSIGTHFHARLAEYGLPPYRFTLTSILRSTEDQNSLRRTNANAARGRSSHEYATTFDIAYRRYHYGGSPEDRLPHPPAEMVGFLRSSLHAEAVMHARSRYDEAAQTHHEQLAALLGRALIALEDEGVLLALRESRQPVYHTTVARKLTRTPACQE